ncbi:MAG TPA: hypothetical protein PKM88_14360 [bacterium]|nr:hypothetical protein [bacterium]
MDMKGRIMATAVGGIIVIAMLTAAAPYAMANRRPTLEERVTTLERKVALLETTHGISAAADTSATTVRSPRRGDESPIGIRLIGKSFHQSDPLAGDYLDRIEFSFEFRNGLHQAVKAFTGTVVFKDLFDRVILRIGLTENADIAPGATSEYQGGIDYNQFLAEHRTLAEQDAENLKVDFILDSVIYHDGSRADFPGIHQ